ncbi:MAG: PAS domain-containing sensor histidine kinase [Magnetococcales bacterium]|nr:PAS domain-containing sensor histidine kinase [Magnetococcales bacterium]
MKKKAFKKWLARLNDLAPEQRDRLMDKCAPASPGKQDDDGFGEYLDSDEFTSLDQDNDKLEMNRRSFRGIKYREVIRLLTEESEYVRKVIDLSEDMIVSADDDRGINVFNKAAERVYGYQTREVRGKPVSILYSSPEEAKLVRETMARQGFFHGEIAGRRKNGNSFPMRLIASQLHNTMGDVIGSVGYSRDVTPEKKAAEIERQYTALNELENLRRDVEQITRHDLKSPLTSIIGFSDILLHDERMAEEHKKLLKIIYKAGFKANRMINLSLDIFKMEKGTYQVMAEKIEVVPLLEEIIMGLESQIQAKSLTTRIHMGEAPGAPPVPLFISGEESLCYNLFANLIKNAAEASPNDQPVTITLDGDALAVIKIHNFGVVPEEIRERFFEKYVTMGKKYGTGLGTYSAHMMAKTLGGKIEMVSTEGDGTTLTVTLPGGWEREL